VIAVADTSGLKSITNDVKPAAKEERLRTDILSSDDDKIGCARGFWKWVRRKLPMIRNFLSAQSDGSKNDLLQIRAIQAILIKTVSSSKLITEAEQTKTIKQANDSWFCQEYSTCEKQSITYQLSRNLGKVKLVVRSCSESDKYAHRVENEQVKQFIQSNIDQLKSSPWTIGVFTWSAVSVRPV